MARTFDDELRALKSERDLDIRARKIGELLSRLQAAQDETTRLRDQTIRELVGAGRSNVAIAGLLKVSRARVTQLRSEAAKRESTSRADTISDAFVERGRRIE